MSDRKTCFVIMGFGEKTDFQSSPQRVLDLNYTYQHIIEPSVKECALDCIRADQIIHSTVIDKPMYERLLDADICIADLSTSNANAIYELGVRHALRPHTTIVMAENGFAFPFDLNHLSILKYNHMGREIGYAEVMRVRNQLKAKIITLLAAPETDSPVFLFLPQLLKNAIAPAPASTEPARDDTSFADLMKQFRQEKANVQKHDDWLAVIAVLNRLLNLQPADPYLTQQLALATYKSKHPDAIAALGNAKAILAELFPDASSDVETIGLWGAIHKRLWEVVAKAEDLAIAIRAYARGYYIKYDHYNGINFAFLLNVRARQSQGDDAIADRVLARRVREGLLSACDAALAPGTLGQDDAYWMIATKVEALLGIGRVAESAALREQLRAGVGLDAAPAHWMVGSLDEQLAKLAALEP